jgi:hypothetical protein
MMSRSSCAAVAIAGLGLVAAVPAAAIQEVTLGPRAPTLSTAPAPGLGWGMAPSAASLAPPPGFTQGFTTFDGGPAKAGALMLSTTSGPSWATTSPMGFSSFGSGIGSSFGRADLGWTTRSTAGVMATDTLMFYTSVGQTNWRNGSGVVPSAPGLALIEGPSVRNDVRAGFKMELMPGLSFGMEAAFSQGPQR